MQTHQIEMFGADQLRDYLDSNNENRYLLLDVRQPEEYADTHIPGARLIPLPELEHRLHEIDPDREVLVYCRSGNRSMVAARFVVDSGLAPARIVNVVGGITAWSGNTLKGFPKLTVLAAASDERELLERIIDMERGAFQFYRTMSEKLPEGPFAKAVGLLVGMEQAHARSAYDLWKDRIGESLPPFEELFESAGGGLVEGGEDLQDVARRMVERPLDLAELALEIELRAYDLYRTAADLTRDVHEQRSFLLLAEQEKAHARLISRNWMG